ncbi:four helix bundle protein [Candidatus Poribacteria bacterium]
MRHFEDSDAWKLARTLVKEVYSLTLRDGFRRDFGLVDQIRRAAVSVMNNIAEGFERGSNKEFIRFLFIARGSAGEVRSLLYVALDQGYITESEFKDTCDLCIRSSQMIWELIRYLRNSPKTPKS